MTHSQALGEKGAEGDGHSQFYGPIEEVPKPEATNPEGGATQAEKEEDGGESKIYAPNTQSTALEQPEPPSDAPELASSIVESKEVPKPEANEEDHEFRTTVWACIDMSGSMCPFVDDMHEAIASYLTQMQKDLAPNTDLRLSYFNDDVHVVYSGLLIECPISTCVQKYLPFGMTGLYRTQWYAIEAMNRAQEHHPKGARPFIMMTMTDGRNNHKSKCQAIDVVRLHNGNPHIDRSLMVIEGMRGEALADELGIPRERLTYFARGQETGALEEQALYSSQRSEMYSSAYHGK